MLQSKEEEIFRMFLSKLFKRKIVTKPPLTSKSTETPSKTDQGYWERERNRRSQRKGELGEYKIDIQLNQLPKDCRYINDLMIHNPKAHSGYSQIDHVVISPYGVFVIETKNHAGNIYGLKKDKMWLRDGRYEFYNPFWQNYGHIQAVKELLKDFDIRTYHSIVTFTLRASISDIDDELKNVRTSPELVIYDTALLDTINRRLAISARGGLPHLSKLDVERIHAKLSRSNITDVQTREEHVNKNKLRQTAGQGNLTSNGGECTDCGRSVSQKVKEFCLTNRNRFGGKVYCYEHQTRF